jgi:Na+/H+-dicarboxylate symporter
MWANTPNRRASTISAIAVLFLAFTVLAWGTSYKMSILYTPASSTHELTPVKLLSQKERPTKVVESLLPAAPKQQSSRYYPAILIFALMFGLRLMVSNSMLEVWLDDLRKQRSAHTSFFSFHPPPVFLLSN